MYMLGIELNNQKVIQLSQQPLRILFFFGIMNRGGAECFVMDIYRHIDRDKVQFDFVVNDGRRGHFDQEIHDLGGRIFIVSSPGEVGISRYRQQISDVIQEYGPFHGIHSQVYYFSGAILQVASQMAIPVRIANSNSIQDGQRNTWIRKLYRWYMKKLILKHSTNLLGVSREACTSLFGHNCFERDNVTVIPNGINLDNYRKVNIDKSWLRQKLQLPMYSPLIGHVGRFNTPKNHSFLIDVFSCLLKQIPEANLVLVGDGPLRADIEQLIRDKGIENQVHFLGMREDVPEILGALDVFLFPSLYEGLGLALVEAQAAGIPSVASDMIPADVDLGLGLVQFISLQAELEQWVTAIVNYMHTERLSWEAIEQNIRERNYDIKGLSKQLQAIYLGRN
jgi:glycosyltransferase EpsF